MSRPESDSGLGPGFGSSEINPSSASDQTAVGAPAARATSSAADLDSLLSLRTPTVDDQRRGEVVASDGVVGELRQIDVDSIVPNEFQPRRRFDEQALAALTESIREMGVLQPVLVRPEGSGLFELIAGERRWRAARRAGLPSVPAIVRSTEDQGSLEQAIVENLHREDLTALEEAFAYQQLVEDFDLTQDEVAARVGKSRSAVSNTLRLFQLPAPVQRMVGDGQLSAGHARAILGLDDADAQIVLAERVVREELSVRATELAVKVGVAQPDSGGPERPTDRRTDRGDSKSAGALEVERALEDRLATKIDVIESDGNGRIIIRFADRADLDRIYRLLAD